MIIKSISLKDFECYSGPQEDNTFNFTHGINLIIGDNGGGKSKLFNGFYWAIYDHVFNSDKREFVPTSSYKENLISDKAKRNCLEGESCTAEVNLIVEDSSGSEFKITRIFRSKKVDKYKWVGESSSRLLVFEYKGANWQSSPSEKHHSILERVLPGHLKPYMWFQGEQVDSLMDFSDKTALMQAINILSDITDYDNIVEIAEAGNIRATKDYHAAENKLSRNKNESDRLLIEIDKNEKRLKDLEDSKAHNEKQKNLAQSLFDGLVNQIEDAQKKAALKKDRERLSEEVRTIQLKLDNALNSLNKKIFTESWLLRSVEPIFKDYYEKYNAYYLAHQERINLNNAVIDRLPINIPQPIHVNQMLEDEICYVCGREAKAGSNAHFHIKELLARQYNKSDSIFENDCSGLFDRFYTHSLGFEQFLVNIDKNISSEFSSILDKKTLVSSKTDELKAIDYQFEELISSDKSESIVQEFKTHQRKIEDYTGRMADDSKQIENIQRTLEGLRLQASKLVDGQIDKAVTAARDIFSSLYKISLSTRSKVFSDLVNELEESANLIFQKMTSENSSITGRLRLKMISEDSCIPEIIDRNGHIMYGSNDSNIILVKLSLIMAIVTSKAKWSTNYCLISDAPTSKMSKKYSNGFYKALGVNFYQSIVMTYDFLSEEDRKSLLEFKVGSVYRIESTYPAGDREDRTDLTTRIVEISL